MDGKGRIPGQGGPVWTQTGPAQSCCQLANLLAGFSGWLSLQVGEAVLSHGAFPDIGEGAKKTQGPRDTVLEVGMLEG